MATNYNPTSMTITVGGKPLLIHTGNVDVEWTHVSPRSGDTVLHDPDRVSHGVIPMRFNQPVTRATIPRVNGVLILGDPIDLEATSEHDQRSST